MTNDLKLLVEWSSPWREFWASIRPALAKSATPLAGEARTDFFPYQGILLSWAIEVTLLVAVRLPPSVIVALKT